ncbi:apoptotic protease-activating factor 1-like isoform X2 [Neodiprion virginianus]|uniref:apoptotic protease-activating factor 1-like isoform X2 n=1 Tax=Neodiprion virginianus TaxID=2961670 RepID=UPI001EE6BD1D|nr:apoptotic protease-activating factor 1-like isoform X2 [Neodiprion virginianus]
MEEKHRNILLQVQPAIVRDLDYQNVLDTLVAENIITLASNEEILNAGNRELQIRKLLSHLPGRGPKAYSIFKEAMRLNYDWISKEMDELEENFDSVDSLDAPVGQNVPHPHLPAIPSLNVSRTRKLRKGLKELKPSNYLALHALPGYGKSTLVSETLQDDDLATDLFQKEMYWIKFGSEQSVAENILTQLNMLFHRVRNLDLLTEPTSEDSLKYFLRHHFSKHNHALLILDDVNRREIIEAFDFGCKTLVLTTDTDILRGKKCDIIEMNEGFTPKESLALFAKAIGVDASELPKQARQIHEECKGMPLMIAMFSAQFEDVKESLIEGDKRADTWSYYLDALKKKKSAVLQESLDKLKAIFEMCINKLSKDEIHYYEMFAIFPEDVNITTKTLSIFWDLDPPEVDLIMSKFCKKSMAVRQWHVHLKTYIYGVHNLVLRHLRDKLTAESLMNLHKTYVNKNFEACNWKLSNLPKDNYIYSYIGHHMEEGELLNKFPEVYLNFKFIEAKIYHIGPGDLLIDLKKYRKHITQESPELLDKVTDLEKFLVQQASTLAEYRRRNCLDLVQVALKHPYSGFVRDMAESLANERQSSLYLSHLKNNNQNLNSLSDELYMQVRSVAFTNEASVILIGNDMGEVVLWNCHDGHHVVFYGNNRDYPIRKIITPRNGEYFVSISEDGTAKLFDLSKQREFYMKTLNPRTRQKDWKTMYENDINQDHSKFTFAVKDQKIMDISICSSSQKIAACTKNGNIMVWKWTGEVFIDQISMAGNSTLNCILFTISSTKLHTVNLETGALTMYDATHGNYVTQCTLSSEMVKVISLLSVPGVANIMIGLLDKKLFSVTWKLDEITGYPTYTEFAKLADETVTYTCAALTQDGRYVITADTGCSVTIHSLRNGYKTIKTYKKSVTSLDTQWLENERCHMICAGSCDTLVPMVHRWRFDPTENPVSQRLPLFDAIVESVEKNIIAVATSNRTVQIIQNDNVIAEAPSVNAKITNIMFFEDKNRVAYATEGGQIFLFDLKHKHYDQILQLSYSVRFMTILGIEEKNVIVCNNGPADLQIWEGPEDNQLIENSGSVIFSKYLKNVKHVLTVANEVAKLWDRKWRLRVKYVPTKMRKVSCCSLSDEENYLALANASGCLTICKLVPKKVGNTIAFQENTVQNLPDEITACNFSPNGTLLAVGMKRGKIMIIDGKSSKEIQLLDLHRRAVKQLYWGPSSLNEQILLSLSNEMAWWNISRIGESSSQNNIAGSNRQISQSYTDLTVSSNLNVTTDLNLPREPLKNSQSFQFSSVIQESKNKSLNNNHDDATEEVSNSTGSAVSAYSSEQDTNEINGNGHNSPSFCWSDKRPKDFDTPGLLSVVKLDGNLATNVCISKNFKRFITIDGEGSIYNLAVIEKNGMNKHHTIS